MPSCDKETTEEYTLTIIVNPSGGGTTSPAVGSHEYDDGTEVNVTAIAADGYEFDHWSGGLSGSQNPAGITMDSDMEITAHFAPIVTYTLTVDPSEGGTIDIDPLLNSYEPGDEVTLTANPETGYEFDGWSGDLSGTEPSATITMDSNKEIIASFIPSMYTLTATANLPSWGTVHVSHPGPYEYGDEVTLTAIPADGYLFSRWSGVAAGYTNQVTITMDSDKTVTAHFRATLTVEVRSTRPNAGTVEIYPDLVSYEPGAPVQLTVHLNSASYTFEGWETSEGSSLGDDTTITITMDSAKTIYAVINCHT